jgi:hypothetical protein
MHRAEDLPSLITTTPHAPDSCAEIATNPEEAIRVITSLSGNRDNTT